MTVKAFVERLWFIAPPSPVTFTVSKETVDAWEEIIRPSAFALRKAGERAAQGIAHVIPRVS